MISVAVLTEEFYNAAVTMLQEHGISGDFKYVEHSPTASLVIENATSTNDSDDTIGTQVLKLVGVMPWPPITAEILKDETNPQSEPAQNMFVKPTITVPTQTAEPVTGNDSNKQSTA